MRTCSRARLRGGVRGVLGERRGAPRAAAGRACRTPSTSPRRHRSRNALRRGRIRLSRLNLGLLRRFPATAAAAAVAAVLVIIAVTHGTGTPRTRSTIRRRRGHGPGPVPAVATASCTQPIVRVTGSSPPTDYSAAAAGQPPVPTRRAPGRSPRPPSMSRPVTRSTSTRSSWCPCPRPRLPAPHPAPPRRWPSVPAYPSVVEGTSIGLVPASYGSSVPVAVPGPANRRPRQPAAAGATERLRCRGDLRHPRRARCPAPSST